MEMSSSNERIIYCDHFYPQSSNFYWLRAFEKIASVVTHDLHKETIPTLWQKIQSHRPHHIHMGGGAKTDLVPLNLLREAKVQHQLSISHLYGDCQFTPYHFRTAHYVDQFYFTNKSHIEWANVKGFYNFYYIPQATDPTVYHPVDVPKKYDVVFIGNNNDASRLQLLKRIANHFELTVFGQGWENTGLNHQEPVFEGNYNQVISSAKVVLSLIGEQWSFLKCYFSNRLINSLAAGGCAVQTYSDGLEDVFQNEEHLLWYQTDEELLNSIKKALENDSFREQIAQAGREKVLADYTFDKTAERILSKGRKARERYASVEYAVLKKSGRKLFIQDCNLCNESGELLASLSSKGLPLRDSAGLITEPPSDIVISQSSIPSSPLERAELWMKIRLAAQPQTRITIDSDSDSLAEYTKELSMFGVKHQPLVNSSNQFFCRPFPEHGLDKFYVKIMNSIQPRFGLRYNPLLKLEWCYLHTLIQAVAEQGLLQGMVLVLHAGLGEFPFALRIHKQCSITAIEASWMALQYARLTYGFEDLVFLPPCLSLLPEQYFDSLVVITFQNIAQNINAQVASALGLIKPEGQIFIGIHTLEPDELHPTLQNPNWLNFGTDTISLEKWDCGENIFYAILRLMPLT